MDEAAAEDELAEAEDGTGANSPARECTLLAPARAKSDDADRAGAGAAEELLCSSALRSMHSRWLVIGSTVELSV